MSLSLLPLFVCVVGLVLYATAWTLLVAWTLRRKRGVVPTTGVSILKPLCGRDEELERNLESFFALEHEPLQLVFGAADPADPALVIVRQLARRHPHRDVTIVVGCDDSAASPKVGVLERLLPRAVHDVILLSDSNVRVRPDEIAGVLPCFSDPAVGMAYQVVVGIGERTLPAAVENLHYTEFAGLLSVGTALLVGEHAVNAKGQWVRRSALEAIGGFTGVRDHGADDYALSRLVAGAGWKLSLAPLPVRIVHREWSWRQLASRHLRHSGLRRRLCPWAYPLELVINPVPWTLLLLATPHAAWVPAFVATKLFLEITAARILRGTPLAWRHAACIPLKDLGYFVGWFASFAVRGVEWRGRSYRIGPGGRLLPTSDPVPARAAHAA